MHTFNEGLFNPVVLDVEETPISASIAELRRCFCLCSLHIHDALGQFGGAEKCTDVDHWQSSLAICSHHFFTQKGLLHLSNQAKQTKQKNCQAQPQAEQAVYYLSSP